MRKRIFSVFMFCVLIVTLSVQVLAHSGRTDANGGHRDNKNKSGLGSYHYHCGGYPPHLHNGGYCPYKGNATTSSSSTSSSSSKPKTVYATQVKVSNMPKYLKVDESVKLDATVYPSNAVDQSISWKSSDTSIAKVDSSGNLTAVGVGTVVISAETSRGTISKFNLTIQEVVADDMTIISKPENIVIGDDLYLYTQFSPENVTYKNVEWTSSDMSVVSVNSYGKLEAIGVGHAVITAKHKEITDSFTIEVLPILASSIDVFCENENVERQREGMRIEVGQTLALQTLILPEDTTDKTIRWTVNPTAIAAVDENGVLTARAKGKATLTAETVNGLQKNIEIEVYEVSVPLVLLQVSMFLGVLIFLVVGLLKKIKKQKADRAKNIAA